MTREERFANKFAEAVSHRDFSPEAFANYIMQQDPYVAAFLIRTALNLTEMTAELIKRDFTHPEYGMAKYLATELGMLKK